MKAKSSRMPLKDVSNNNNNNVIESKKKKKKIINNQTNLDVDQPQEDYTVDRFLLLHSDLSTILYQINELVVEAVKLKNVNKEGREEIESFSDVLSSMLSSLKPWVPRFQKALSSTPLAESEILPHQALESKSVSSYDIDESDVCDSPAETTLVSPSPLVSWRANCTIQRGRQMFMLTPLPMSKALSTKHQQPSNSEFNKLSSIGTSSFIALDMTDLLDNVAMKQTPKKPVPSIAIEEANNNQELGLISSPLVPKRDSSMIVMMTPCLKMSPPKSCVLLEPISEMGHLGNEKVCNRKSTPFPVGIHYSDSEDSESPGSGHASQGLAFKYPELLGIHNIPKSGIAKKTVEASPDWLMSPPKTCVLLEPPDEVSLNLEKVDNISCLQITNPIGKQQIRKLKDDVPKEHNQTNKSCKQGNFGVNLSHVEGTPMWQEPESSFQSGKRPGENTLKKELWTKFEAASTYIVQPKLPTIGENIQKGFLDLLEEASSDG
ncbi:hypothetical protein Lal_00032083 [Lupinus albus]|uniref:Uncharacterized protein n=1 Tax=Lupinus albus TaxID=3870 RepID=A0A6A5PMF6_LUPAL|nr:hypothetical protein Lalb_Chr01g0013161 [Lupinus albus]KAF1898503.1 hypothetical protein Lal_00032083 [Lupinus albus]